MTENTEKSQAAAQPSVAAPQQVDYAKYIGYYIQLRDKEKELKAKHKEELRPYTEAMAKIEALCGNHMTEAKLESMKTSAGTCYETVTSTASIKDSTEFKAFVLENRAWDMLDWKCNATAAQDFLREHQVMPPGVALTSFRKVNFRRPTNKADD